MGIKFDRLVLFTSMIISLTLSQSTFASWSGPDKLVEGLWGCAPNQFGKEHNGFEDNVPIFVGVMPTSELVIADIVNLRQSIYNMDGTLKTVFEYAMKLDENGSEYFEITEKKYAIDHINRYLENGNYYMGTGPYSFRSQTGDIISTYEKRPAELGIRTREVKSSEHYTTTIKYEDITYTVKLDEQWKSYSRDQSNNLSFCDSYTVRDPVSDDDTVAWFVVKFDSCGKRLSKLFLPVSEYEPFTQEELNLPVSIRHKVRNEYGPPVIGPDGSVYAWKRTPTTYGILKWTWIDSPDDPKGGPDAPADLNVAPATIGLTVTWTASPQDPGCVEGYEVERSSTSGGIFSTITTTAPGAVSYSDTGVLSGSSAFYRVRAKSSCGPSDYTAVIGGTRP